MILKELNEKMETVPGTLPNMVKRIKEKYDILSEKEGKKEGFGTATPIIMFILSLICSIVFFMYANYILVKCYCSHYGHYFIASILMYAVPYITIPYLYYQRFSERGSCRTFPCGIQTVK